MNSRFSRSLLGCVAVLLVLGHAGPASATPHGPPYQNQSTEVLQYPDTLGFGTATSSATLDRLTGAMDVETAVTESFPVGTFVVVYGPDGCCLVHHGFGQSLARAVSTFETMVPVTAPGTGQILFTGIATSTAASMAGPVGAISGLHGQRAAIGVRAQPRFYPCAISVDCAPSSTGPVVDATLAENGSPAPSTFTLFFDVPAGASKAFVLVQLNAESSSAGSGSASATGSATLAYVTTP